MHSADDRHYCVYILTNRSKTLYVGVTNNLHRRVWEHKFRNGSEFCRRYKIDRLVYYESFDDVRNAIDREKRIKGWLRIKKIQMIVSVNPAWSDLSEGVVRAASLRAAKYIGPSLRMTDLGVTVKARSTSAASCPRLRSAHRSACVRRNPRSCRASA
jgi:putative endonuclease